MDSGSEEASLPYQQRKPMRKIFTTLLFVSGLAAITLCAQEHPNTLSPVTKSFIAIDSPIIALQHVRVIDGTGAPAAENQTILVEQGNIREIGPDSSVSVPQGAKILDLAGRSVIPGLVGMH